MTQKLAAHTSTGAQIMKGFYLKKKQIAKDYIIAKPLVAHAAQVGSGYRYPLPSSNRRPEACDSNESDFAQLSHPVADDRPIPACARRSNASTVHAACQPSAYCACMTRTNID